MMTPTEFSSRLKARPRTPVPRELDHFAGHDAGQAVDAGDAVADFQHPADLAGLELAAVLFNFRLEN